MATAEELERSSCYLYLDFTFIIPSLSVNNTLKECVQMR